MANSSVKSPLKASMDTYAKLNKEQKGVKAKIEKCEQDISARNKRIIGLYERMHKAKDEKEKKEIQQQITDTKKEIEELKKRIKVYQKTNPETMDMMVEEVSQHPDVRRLVDTRLDAEYRKQIEKNEKEIAEKKEHLENVKTVKEVVENNPQLKTCMQQITTLNKEVKAEKAQYKAQKQKMEQLRTMLRTEKSAKESREGNDSNFDVVRVEARIQKLNEEIAKVEGTIKNTENSINEKTSKIDQAKNIIMGMVGIEHPDLAEKGFDKVMNGVRIADNGEIDVTPMEKDIQTRNEKNEHLTNLREQLKRSMESDLDETKKLRADEVRRRAERQEERQNQARTGTSRTSRVGNAQNQSQGNQVDRSNDPDVLQLDEEHEFDEGDGENLPHVVNFENEGNPVARFFKNLWNRIRNAVGTRVADYREQRDFHRQWQEEEDNRNISWTDANLEEIESEPHFDVSPEATARHASRVESTRERYAEEDNPDFSDLDEPPEYDRKAELAKTRRNLKTLEAQYAEEKKKNKGETQRSWDLYLAIDKAKRDIAYFEETIAKETKQKETINVNYATMDENGNEYAIEDRRTIAKEDIFESDLLKRIYELRKKQIEGMTPVVTETREDERRRQIFGEDLAERTRKAQREDIARRAPKVNRTRDDEDMEL